MLEVKNLNVKTEGKEILKDLNLLIKAGQLHVIMGPNGAGKSTLGNILAGKPGYKITGTVIFGGKDLLEMEPDQRSKAGLFLAFQHPVAIPGLTVSAFLKESLNVHREEPVDAISFRKLINPLLKTCGLDESYLDRYINDGFSGGEKKKLEMVQMLLLNPKLIILDETDSGLDLDALKLVAKTVEQAQSSDNAFLIITHNPKFLEVLHPTQVHLLKNGSIVKTGDKNLVNELEEKGFGLNVIK